ncbi:hypothetical protein V4Y02_23740, partial [Escherichia coli]
PTQASHPTRKRKKMYIELNCRKNSHLGNMLGHIVVLLMAAVARGEEQESEGSSGCGLNSPRLRLEPVHLGC